MRDCAPDGKKPCPLGLRIFAKPCQNIVTGKQSVAKSGARLGARGMARVLPERSRMPSDVSPDWPYSKTMSLLLT